MPVNAAEHLPTVKAPRGMPRPVPDSVIADARERADADEELMLRLGAGGHTRHVPLSPRMAVALRARGDGWIFPGRVDGHISPVVVVVTHSK